MSEDTRTMIAVDCGSSSCRVVEGCFENGQITCRTIGRVSNKMYERDGYLYWDIRRLFDKILDLLSLAVREGRQIDSIAVCTWGVDFALFDKYGHMLQDPLSYRNSIGEKVLSSLSPKQMRECFLRTGILCDKINSVYMLAGIKKTFPELYAQADCLLMIPDILNYFLTGVMQNEPSELSTSQLCRAEETAIDSGICAWFGIDPSLFPPVGTHGTRIGWMKRELLERIGAPYEIPVLCVPSHDTASAVLSIPSNGEPFGFISSGTWSLVGAELQKPVITELAMQNRFTNETGAFGQINLLKNSPGMYINNRLREEYCREVNEDVPWSQIAAMAESAPYYEIIDLELEDFFHPVSMENCIRQHLNIHSKQNADFGVLFRTYYESLAHLYAQTLSNLESTTGEIVENLYFLGGGTANRLLLRRTAEYSGKKVIVCSGESTSLGNLLAQLWYFHPDWTRDDLRDIARRSNRRLELPF